MQLEMQQKSIFYIYLASLANVAVLSFGNHDFIFHTDKNYVDVDDAQPRDHLSSCGVKLSASRSNDPVRENQRISKRVLGGKEAKRHDWPWQSFIRFKKGSSLLTCSGVLVSSNIMLTVAQCTPSNDSNYYLVILGDHDISKSEGNETIHRVKRVIIPKTYNKTTLQNDIALIELEKSVILDKNVNFACLPPATYRTVPGTSCYMTGWGLKKTSKGLGMARKMQELKIPVVSKDVCGNVVGKQLPDSQMCAGTERNSSGGCSYDNGSPLVCYNKQESRWILQGLFSHSSAPCFSNQTRYSIFTRISVYSRAVKRLIDKTRPSPRPTTKFISTGKTSRSTSFPFSTQKSTKQAKKLLSTTQSTFAAKKSTTASLSTASSTVKRSTETPKTTRILKTESSNKVRKPINDIKSDSKIVDLRCLPRYDAVNDDLIVQATTLYRNNAYIPSDGLNYCWDILQHVPVELLHEKQLGIYLRSEGCNDTVRTGKDGHAYIIVNGIDYSSHKRGHNIVIVDILTGKVERNVSFNIVTFPDLIRMKNFLKGMKPRKMLLVAVQSDGSRYQVAVKEMLSKFGATSPYEVSYCSSYCLMGYSGPENVVWRRQESRKQNEGPSEIYGIVPQSGDVIKIRVESGIFGNDQKGQKKDDAYIWVNGLDVSPHKDGHNVVTLDLDTGTMKQALGFHTKFSLPESKLLARFISKLQQRQIIVVVTQGGSSRYHWMIRKALSKYGATSKSELQRERLYAFIGYSGSEKVSWTAETYSTMNKRTINLEVFIKKGFSTCGLTSQSLPRWVKYVVGGGGSKKGQWPCMASITDDRDKLICGATLITDQWLVTAAHCFVGTTNRLRPLKVTLGSAKYFGTEGSENISIAEIQSHPKFDPNTYDYDIAVIKLQRKVTIRNDIRTICIGETERIIPENCYVTGWGRLIQGGRYPEDLKHAKVPLVSTKTCNNTKTYTGRITDRMICAGYDKGGIDACQGDSGGPLSCQDASGYWHLVGIVSWGVGCALRDHYGVYTNVSLFKEWVFKATQT